MMEPVFRVDGSNACAVEGNIIYDYPKAIWNLGMLLIALIFIIPTISLAPIILFFTSTYATLLIGHSVGMHRLMIHQTFQCPSWLEKTLIYIGVLVGFAGPFGIIKTHDLRDWAQRQPACHDYFAHRKTFFKDLWWQLTCKFQFEKPPTINIESHYTDDRFYQFLEKTWRWHQLLPAIILYVIGGWSFVVWGICLRIFVSVAGHWTITYFCHNPRYFKNAGPWRVYTKDIENSVQAANIPGLGLLTYGECWHNNHHAFPESARIGLDKGQYDPAWWVINLLGYLGLAYNIGYPRGTSDREDLQLQLSQ